MTEQATLPHHTANDILREEYNQAPYQSFPFQQTHPTHLFTIGKLFGLKPKPVEKARILELGCAGGGNLIPIAYHFPHAELLGIDLADKQIDEGIEKILDLKLKNITLRHQSILDFGVNEGKFDYIICHGVYSWVNNEVRDKILQICKENLAPQGLAYISYNTFPGWNMVNSIRDMMRWHTQNISDPATKAQQARIVLKFISDGLQDDQSPYAVSLRNEINLLSKHADSYLLHEHLSSFNNPVYFHEFMEQATKHKLSYLSDAILETMFTDNLSPVFANELKKINNIIVAGQYMDFIRNQRFRCTLLCHEEQKINRSLKTTDVEQFYLQYAGRTQNPQLTENDLAEGKDVVFMNNTITYTIRNHFSQMAMYTLFKEQFKAIHYDELCKKLSHIMGIKDMEKIRKHVCEDLNLMRTVLGGMVNISAYPPNYTLEVSEMPTACAFARYQAKKQPFATNRRHQPITLSLLSQAILPHLDGTNNLDSLITHVEADIQIGKLSLVNKEKQPITDEVERKAQLNEIINNELKFLAINAFLVK